MQVAAKPATSCLSQARALARANILPSRRPLAVCYAANNVQSFRNGPLPTPVVASVLDVTPIAAAEATAHPWYQPLLSSFSKAAVLVGLMVAVAMSTASSAFAARSGGRVGGSSGFSARSTARASSTFSPATRSAASSPRSTHTTTVVHTGGYGWGMPSFFFPVVPFGGYYGHGGGGSVLSTVLLMGVVALLAVAAFKTLRPKGSSGSDDYEVEEEDGSVPVTVAKVTVCLLAVAKDIKADLNMLAARADSSTPEGLHLILQETVLALMRNPEYCVYAASSTKVLDEPEEAERAFNAFSMEERGKLKEETLVNYGGISKSKAMASPGSDGVAELIVVNLMVAAEGEIELPAIRNQADLRIALSRLGGVSPSDVMAVELLWTPQAEDDVLTQQECLVAYPNLVPL